MILIDKIVFENYRQYGSGTLRFTTSDKSKLSVLIAKNGTGKTTLLNAITWCLYGKELHLADADTALPIVNESIVNASADEAFVPVSVKITIVDEDHIVDFKRSTTFKVMRDSNDVARVIPGSGNFTVTTTASHDFENSQVSQGVDADMVVKQYFDEAIFRYYFFDGEKLRDYFAVGQSASIKSSIFNISQITLLENACIHLKKIHGDKNRILAKGSPDIANLQKQKDDQIKSKQIAQNSLEANTAALEILRKEQTDLNEALRGFEPIKKLQQERTELEKRLTAVTSEEKQWHMRRSDFVRKYLILLNLYPCIKHTLDIITQKEKDGDLPPAIDKDQVKMLLAHLDEPCPLCHGTIGETGRQHLESLLAKISVSSKTSNYLKEIKGPLESFLEDAVNYKNARNQLNQEEIDISARKDKITQRLTEINSYLSNYDSGEESFDVAKAENRRTEVNSQIDNANRSIGAAESTIRTCDGIIAKIDKDLSEAAKKIKEHADIKAQLDVLDEMQKQFNRIKEHIMSAMRKEIERTTWDIFDAMIWKSNTFGHITISDNYDVAVYNKQGNKMTGSLSATEQMALAYAFTLAIHKASGKNCPLVIDSPLGRVSDDNRENMAKALGEISKDKQLIMLFTPDEYSESVRSMYDEFADVRALHLSDDENFIEGMED